MPLLETKRLFIAIELPVEIRDILEKIQRELRTSGADAKWVEPHNIHLTLKFLGSVPIEKIQTIADTLSSFFKALKCFQVALYELGAFPMLSSPRIIWAGLSDKNRSLNTIAADLENALFKFGFKRETRGFAPHCTLGRIRSPRNKIALIEKIHKANLDLKKEKFLIDNITLFESRLSPRGPTYSILHQIKFK